MRFSINSVAWVSVCAGLWAVSYVAPCLSQTPSASATAANPSKSETVANSSPAANATVKADALAVYADMRTSGAAVASLNKGQGLIVDFEFKSSTEKWCRVKLPAAHSRLGYVLCAGLDRKQDPPHARLGAIEQAFNGSGAGGESPRRTLNVPLAAPSSRSASGYELIASEVVREGMVDVIRLAEFDAAARNGNMATVRRAALGHYAAGNFEVSQNSNEEAIEQYQSALTYAAKHSDLLTATLVRLAYVHLRRSEFSSALQYLDRGRSVTPNSVAVARLSGWAYYGLDRLDEAVAQWRIAQQIEPDPDVATLLEKAENDREAEGGFRSGQTSHFTLHYEGSAAPQLASQILQTLEEDYRSIQGELRFAPQEPVAVVLYTQQGFRDITRAPSWAGAWNDGRIRIPVQGVSSVSDAMARILKHELTHSFVRQETQGHCPQWLHEGLAQWMEGRRTGESARTLVEMYEHRATPPLKVLEGSWTEYSSGQAGLAYAWSLAATEYIVSNSGTWGVERLLQSLAAGSAIEPALGSALQTNYADIERGTSEYLRRTYLQ
jgi:tetratricopeptide (TPR) repeat protein